MIDLGEPTREEIMVVSGSRALRDGDFVLVGVGLPQLSATLAKKTHAPKLKIALEVGVIEPSPIDTAVGIADPRLWYKAEFMGGTLEVLGSLLQRGKVDVGFLSGAQIDQFGNLNSTMVSVRDKEKRINGSGGANDVASLARSTILIMRHERRRFVPNVHYLTSPGYINGGHERSKIGLLGKGPKLVITNLCTLTFDSETEMMRIESIHPGVTPNEVKTNTGFEIDIADNFKTTEPPTTDELNLLREVIDPNHVYIGKTT